MGEPLAPATRPSRLPLTAQIAAGGLLFLSLLSGLLVWWGQSIQLREWQSPFWLRWCLVLHGCLSPFLCGLFGYLCCVHIRLGWQLRANLLSGLIIETVFLGLILSGTALYYAGSEEWRERLGAGAHRWLGILLPFVLGAHWAAGLRWAKKTSK